MTGTVPGWCAVVVLFHAPWDASSGIAGWLTLLLTGTPRQWLLIQLDDVPRVTGGQVHLFTALSWALLVLDGSVGLLVLRGRWHRATVVSPMDAGGR
jgi:hypothetical protein